MNKLNSTIEQSDEMSESPEARAQGYFKDLRGQFASLPMIIFADVRNNKLKHRDVCLYAHLLVKQGFNKSSFWGVDSLALLTGTNKTSVKESLRRLLACGHIKRTRGKNTSHSVCLTKMTPGLGSEGIQVKGRDFSEIEEDETYWLVVAPVRRSKAVRPRPLTKTPPAKVVNEYEEDNGEGSEKF